MAASSPNKHSSQDELTGIQKKMKLTSGNATARILVQFYSPCATNVYTSIFVYTDDFWHLGAHAAGQTEELMGFLLEATQRAIMSPTPPVILGIRFMGPMEEDCAVHLTYIDGVYGFSDNPPTTQDPRSLEKNLSATCLVVTMQEITGTYNNETGHVKWEFPEGATTVIPPIPNGTALYDTWFPVLVIGEEAENKLRRVTECLDWNEHVCTTEQEE